MKLKPGYKQTELGVIPEEWEVRRLDSLGSGAVPPIKAGPFGSVLTKNTYVPNGYKVYGQEQVIRGDYLYGDYFIPLAKFRELESCSISPGDILLSLVGTAGKLLVVPDDAPAGVINPRLIRFSFDQRRVCPQFFKELFETGQVQSLLARYAQGGTMGVLNAGILRAVSIPLPPLPEQRAIARALSDVDALIGVLDRLIAKKRDLKQAAMQQLLPGQRRLPSFGDGREYRTTSFAQLPEDWRLVPLKLISSMSGRIGWQGLKQEEFTSVESDPFLITGMNFQAGRIRWDEVYHIPAKRYDEARPIQLRGGDILMTKDGTIGKLLFVENIPFPGKASLNSHLLVFRPLNESYVPKFLFYQLSSKKLADYVDLNKSGTTFFGITQKAVGDYPACLPSIEEQTAIAAVLSDMDAEIVALEQRRDKTRALKQGMMQELLTGRTRLV